MKKFVFIALLIIPLVGFSQTIKPIDGILNIKFGSSKAVVMASLKAKGGKLDAAHSSADVKMFMNVKYGQKEPVALIVKFLNDKFYIAIFIFKANSDLNTIEYYNDLVSDVNNLYGKGLPTKTFSTGFADGDGKEIEAIQSGNADYHTSWNSGRGFILVVINKKLYVGLTCQDNKLSQQANPN